MNHKIPKLLFKPLLSVFLLLCTLNLYAQRYNFQHYDLVNGLAQSQVLAICQDNEKQIWLSTFGGINCFDGNQFNLYSISEGLLSNANFTLACDSRGTIWVGGNYGLTAFTNKGPVHYRFKNKKINVRSITRIACDKNNGVWAIAGQKLFKLIDDELVMQTVSNEKEFVTDIELDGSQNVYAVVYKSGVYKYDQKSWKLTIPVKDEYVKFFLFDQHSTGSITFISDDGLFQCSATSFRKIDNPGFYSDGLELYCLTRDRNQNLWIGTNKGAALLTGDKPARYFNETNGFTGTRTLKILCDKDNHLWFGTDGAGLYYYQNDDFVIYDKSQGLTNEVVMSLAKDAKGQMYWGTSGGGLWSFSNNKIRLENVYSSESSKLRVNCLLSDKKENLWVGTDNFGLWVKHKVNGKYSYSPVSSKQQLVFNFMVEDSSNTVWAATNAGCFYINNNFLEPVPDFHQYCSALLVKGDSLLVGSLGGISLIRNKKHDTTFKLKAVAGKNVLTMKSHGKFILIGTNDHGLFIWNTKTNAVNNITIKNGLHSNAIYSIAVVNDDVWLGTGRGVNKFKITNQDEMILSKDAVFNMVAEANQNSILHTDSNVWVGTTHGLYVYKINRSEPFPPVPNMVIQSIGLFVKDSRDSIKYTYKNGYKLPVSLSVPSDQSHISIKFQAIEFTDERNIYYQYQLEGLDTAYSKPILNNFVDYPSLPPGRYTFKVRAVNDMGQYEEPAVFAFIVTPTFVQSVWFKILVVILFLSIGYSIYLYKLYQNDKKAKYIETLKLEEQAAVRRQTAEDFHDDLGNKLTRINMLSELLDKKIDKNKDDEKVLIKQIRSSVAELYAGTKNILWALNPDNDNLQDVSALIIKFGCELFSDTHISLKATDENPEFKKIRLPLGFGRNIILIGKELLHNILQHSNAKTVTINIETTSYKHICITISDDGKGFESDQVFAGNGLRNMQNRAKKLNGKLDVESKINVGTISRLILPIP